jgi:hypothetical protein
MATPSPISITPPQSSPESSPRVSPRVDPFTRLGPIEIYYNLPDQKKGHQNSLVGGIFHDQMQQCSVFTQLVELERAGVRKFNYFMNPNIVEFVLSDSTKAALFVERIKSLAKILTPSSSRSPSEELLTYTPRSKSSSSSHSPHMPFKRWGSLTMEMTSEVNESRGKLYTVHVRFDDADRQSVVRKEIDPLFEEGVLNFTYSLNEPVIAFTFGNESKALAFMEKIKQPEPPQAFTLQDDSKMRS